MKIAELNIFDMLEPRLGVLIPVCWGIGFILKSTKIKNKYIPIFLSLCSISLSALYIFAVDTNKNIPMNIFMSITQGIGYWVTSWIIYEKIIKPLSKRSSINH